MAKIRVGGAEIGYDDKGSGLPVILVHAGLADRRMWEPQFQALSESHRVIRYDWRGLGESGDVTGGEVEHHADLLGLMDALDLDGAVLVGSSMGGAYAVDVALMAPGRVRGLGLICSAVSGYSWPPEAVEQFRRSVDPGLAARCKRYVDRTAEWVDPADVEAMADANVELMVVGSGRDRAKLDPLFMQAALEMCRGVFSRTWNGPAYYERPLEPGALGRLAGIRVPTLVVNGLADIGAIQGIADLLTLEIAGSRRVDVDAGHLASFERPDEVTAALAQFLETL